MTSIEQPRPFENSDLRRLIALIAAKRWWIVTSVVMFSLMFALAAAVMTPVYRVTAVLVSASTERNRLSDGINSALGQLGGLASLAGVGVGSNDTATEEALAVIKSRQFTERFIEDLDLMPDLFPGQWDSVNAKWKVSEAKQPTPARAFRAFAKLRTVAQDKKTGMVTVQIDWKDRLRAAEWTNELIKRINLEMRARAIAKTEASLTFLEKELATTSIIETREAINRLIEAQVKQRMLANVTDEYAFRVIDKAMAPDADEFVRPNKPLLIVLGPLLGFFFGVTGILIASLVEPRKEQLT